jgi:membrane protease YdiL (CAAX protease family)
MYQEPVGIPEIETTPPEKRIWGPWATAGLGVVILFVFFAVMLVIVGVIAAVLIATHGVAVIDPEHIMDLVMTRLGLLIAVGGIGSYAVGAALILVVIKVRRGKGIGDYLGLKRVGWRTLLLLLLVTAVYLVLVTVIANVANIHEEDTGILIEAYHTSVWPALFWVAVVVFAPVFEEPFVRGFLFEGFRHSRMGLSGAVLLTSLVWTALHLGYSLYSLGAIFAFGIVLGFVRYRTGSLWSTVMMHAFYNAIGMILIALNLG